MALAALAHSMVIGFSPEAFYQCYSGLKVSARAIAHKPHTADSSVDQSHGWQQIKAANAAWASACREKRAHVAMSAEYVAGRVESPQPQ